MCKTTIDNKVVPDRCWYYLLDFNDRDDKETLYDMFDKKRLLDLTHDEFWKLFEFATKSEIETKGEYFDIKDKRIREYK